MTGAAAWDTAAASLPAGRGADCPGRLLMPQKSGEPLKLSLLTLEGAQPSRAECVDPFKVST